MEMNITSGLLDVKDGLAAYNSCRALKSVCVAVAQMVGLSSVAIWNGRQKLKVNRGEPPIPLTIVDTRVSSLPAMSVRLTADASCASPWMIMSWRESISSDKPCASNWFLSFEGVRARAAAE